MARPATSAPDRERLYAILDELPAVVGVLQGPEHEVAFANPRFRTLAGGRESVLGRPLVSLLDTADPRMLALLDRVRRTSRGATGSGWRTEVDGREVHLDYAVVPLGGSDSLLVHAVDVTKRQAAERDREVSLTREREARQEAELAVGRIARLQRMTAALSAAISAQEVAAIVVEHALEALGADAAVITLRDGDELVIHAQAGYSSEVTAGWERFSIDVDTPLTSAVRLNAAILLEDAEECERRYPLLARAGRSFEAIAALPLVFHGEAMGGMGLSFSHARVFTAGDRGFLLALGRQCAQALERARLYEERTYVARTLQQGLLPARLSEVPGLDVAVRYRSISDGGEVGGDFYDLFPTQEDDEMVASRWLLAIGDVCGKGTAAAVLTGVARNTIRAIAQRESDPDAVLSFLNETMLRQHDPSAYCTVGCATIEPAPAGGFALSLASGGHEHPLLLRQGEPPRAIEVQGTVLGAVHSPALERASLTLVPGDVLVYYTDGVTDARNESERFGEARLRETLEAARGGNADAIADAVEAAVHAHQPGRPTDDRAVVVLRAR